MKQRKPLRKRRSRPKKQRLGLRISSGLETLRQLPENSLTLREQTMLKRIKDIHLGTAVGRLTEVDYKNMKQIAAKRGIKLR